MKLITVTLLLLLSMKPFSAEAKAKSDEYIILDPNNFNIQCSANYLNNTFSIYIVSQRSGEDDWPIFKQRVSNATLLMSQCNAIITQARDNDESLILNISPANDVTDLTNILFPHHGFYHRVIDQLDQINQINPKPKFPECR